MPYFSIIAPAGFLAQTKVPRVYTCKEFQENKKCVGSMGRFLDMIKLGVHAGLG